MSFGDAPAPGATPTWPASSSTVIMTAQGHTQDRAELLGARRSLWAHYADPVSCYVYRALPPERRDREAADLAQVFLIGFFWGEDGNPPGLLNYDRSRGVRLRTYIARSIDNFLCSEHRRSTAALRQRLENAASLDQHGERGDLPPARELTVAAIEEIRERYGDEVADSLGPEDALTHSWAIALCNQAVNGVCASLSAKTRPAIEMILDNVQATGKPQHAWVATRVGSTERAVKVRWLRFCRAVEREVRRLLGVETCSADQLDDEVRFVLRHLGLDEKPAAGGEIL
jgi:hypothetical protein